MKQQYDDDYNSSIDGIYLYVKDPNEAKHQSYLKNMKKLVLKSIKIKRFLVNLQIISRMSIKIL